MENNNSNLAEGNQPTENDSFEVNIYGPEYNLMATEDPCLF